MPSGLLSNLRAIAAGKQFFLFESTVSPFSKHNSLCEFYRPSSGFISDSNCQLGNLKNKGALGVVSLARLGLAASGFSCQIFEHYTKKMAASGSAAASGGLKVDSLITRCGNISSLAKTRAVYFADRSIQGCQKARVGIKRRESNNSSRAYGYFIVDASPRFYNFSSLSGMRLKRYQTSLSPCYSDGAVPNVSSSGSSFGEEVGSLAISADQQALAERSLKLLSGSCYLPHPDKEGTGGEDAHFICVDEQAIGVADGVGGWADFGVNAGEYSRQLMYNSVKAIRDEPGDCIDTARVLEKAYSITMARGSSTACIIALTKQGLHAINLGDSGFIVVRDGCTIFQSPVQQHSFNFTYQLECGNRADLPSSGQVFTIPVATGDVIVAGTDGLFDNLYNNEINAIVVHAVRAGFTPEVTAQKIAALARQRAQERDRQTPFSTAAQEAGFRYYGGKLDDITVAVSYITDSANK